MHEANIYYIGNKWHQSNVLFSFRHNWWCLNVITSKTKQCVNVQCKRVWHWYINISELCIDVKSAFQTNIMNRAGSPYWSDWVWWCTTWEGTTELKLRKSLYSAYNSLNSWTQWKQQYWTHNSDGKLAYWTFIKRLLFVTFYGIEETTSLTCSQRYNFPEEWQNITWMMTLSAF